MIRIFRTVTETNKAKNKSLRFYRLETEKKNKNTETDKYFNSSYEKVYKISKMHVLVFCS